MAILGQCRGEQGGARQGGIMGILGNGNGRELWPIDYRIKQKKKNKIVHETPIFIVFWRILKNNYLHLT